MLTFALFARWTSAHPTPPHQCAGAAVQWVHSTQTPLPKLKLKALILLPVRALPQHMLRMKPNATLRFPSCRGKVHRRNNFGALPRPNTLSSSASDLAVNPRKLFSTAGHQATNVRLFERQTGGNLAI